MTDVYSLDRKIREIEKKLAAPLLTKVMQEAQRRGFDFFDRFSLPTFHSMEEAFHCRYFYVPILYKLGMNREAAKTGQATFEYLYPQLHSAVASKIEEWLGKRDPSYDNFLKHHPSIATIEHRIKGTHSIWKKLSSLEEPFGDVIKDYIGVRWVMKIGENRLDALIEGVTLAPLRHLKSYRNQVLPQSSGFDLEPVIKLCYVIDRFPLELQIWGGDIGHFLSAKGYANYKACIPFPPNKNDLSKLEWDNRLTMALEGVNFRRYMFEELVGKRPDYSPFKPFLLQKRPLHHHSLRFSSSPLPLYQLAHLTFETTPSIETTIDRESDSSNPGGFIRS